VIAILETAALADEAEAETQPVAEGTTQ